MSDQTDVSVLEKVAAIRQQQELINAAFNRKLDDPYLVAEFMKAAALRELAEETRALKEILAGGTGAITIGIEKT